MKYKGIIDSILDEMQKEYTSTHEHTTKAINFEYLLGKLFCVYDIVNETLGLDEFLEIYEYRRADRDEISHKFNMEYVNPLYASMRRAS